MGTLIQHYNACRKELCAAAKGGRTITYGDLAKALGLKLARQEWNTVLDPLSKDEVKKTGHDLTLVVVYASGPAKGLGRYFSNLAGGKPPGSTQLDPKNPQQVANYRQALQQVYARYTNVQC